MNDNALMRHGTMVDNQAFEDEYGYEKQCEDCTDIVDDTDYALCDACYKVHCEGDVECEGCGIVRTAVKRFPQGIEGPVVWCRSCALEQIKERRGW